MCIGVPDNQGPRCNANPASSVRGTAHNGIVTRTPGCVTRTREVCHTDDSSVKTWGRSSLIRAWSYLGGVYVENWVTLSLVLAHEAPTSPSGAAQTRGWTQLLTLPLAVASGGICWDRGSGVPLDLWHAHQQISTFNPRTRHAHASKWFSPGRRTWPAENPQRRPDLGISWNV